MPLGEADNHFNVDSRVGWIEPYRTFRQEVCRLKFRSVIRNPHDETKEISGRLVGPKGWECTPCSVRVEPRAQTAVELHINPPSKAKCRRQPIALELSVGKRCFGQIAEALVTMGHKHF